MMRPQAAIDALTNHQEQCDEDGVMVMVSRQALHEVLAYLSPALPYAPPGHEVCSACGRLFKWGETCTRGGCPCGGDL